MIDVEDTILNLVHDLVCLLFGSKCFNGEFSSDEGNDIGNRMIFEAAVDGFFPPRGVGDGSKYWEGGGNVVFPEVNYPGDHSEGGQYV